MTLNLSPERTFPPVFGMDAPDEQLIIQHQCLGMPNGLNLYVPESGGPGIVRIDIIVPGGIMYQNKSLAAVFTARLLREGTLSTPGDILSEHLDYYGTYLDVNTERDKAVISLYAPKRFLAEVVPVLDEIWREASFPEDVVLVERSHQQQDHMVNDRRVAWVARQHFGALLFGESHPYGSFPRHSDYDVIGREDLLGHFRNCYASPGTYLMLSGDVDDAEISLVSKTLGTRSVSVDGCVEGISTSILPDGGNTAFIERPGTVQSALRMGRRLFQRQHPDFMGMQILVTVLGGYFGSRLMKNIREDKGYTYGIGAFMQAYERSSILVISSEVGSAVLEPALNEVRIELKKLREEPVGTQEMDQVRNYILGSMQRSLDGSMSKAERLRGLIDAGEEADYFLRLKKRVLTIQPEELMRLANTWLREEDLSTLVVGPVRDQ